MIYQRPPYNDTGVAMEQSKFLSAFSDTEIALPVPNYEITPRENWKRVIAMDNPLWVPNTAIDYQKLRTKGPLFGAQSGVIHTKDLKDKERFVDWFGTDWTWVADVGGPMVTPGTHLLDDITMWEKKLKFPDLDNIDWSSQVENIMSNHYDKSKVMLCDIGDGCSQKLVAVLGGYTEAMLALAEEPEAVTDFYNYYADFQIRFIDKLLSFFPLDIIDLHDDWGTERDTFFSGRMMEEIVYAPTKKIVDHVKSKGKVFHLHCCGNVTRFIPYMIDMGVDIAQLQRRAVDIPEVKKEYGDRLTIDTQIEGGTAGCSHDQLVSNIRATVNKTGKNGGFTTSVFPSKSLESNWDAVFELYCYSREFYDNFDAGTKL